MNQRVKNIGIIILFAISIFSFVYVNYISGGLHTEGLKLLNAEMTDVKISKFILETLKKVSTSPF